jgi:hypothetical protein
MGGFGNGVDASTWSALGLVLTILGLAGSVLLWRRRGAAAGLRGAAWSLLPLAAGLTGTLRLLWEIAAAIGSWATRLVFSPVVWLGIVVAGVAAVLFVVSAAMRRHGHGGRRAVGAGAAKAPAVRGTRSTPPVSSDDDLDDIAAILKKHGIS